MTNALYPLTPTVGTHYISAFPFSMIVHRFRSIIKELTDIRKPTITPTFHLRLDLWCSQTVATNSFIHTVAEGAHTHPETNQSINNVAFFTSNHIHLLLVFVHKFHVLSCAFHSYYSPHERASVGASNSNLTRIALGQPWASFLQTLTHPDLVRWFWSSIVCSD